MISVNDLSLVFPDKKLFEDVDLIFTPGNCYGIIGANGAGKSTFLKVLSGEKEPTKGSVTFQKGMKLSKLSQDHYAFEGYEVLDTVLMGHEELYKIGKEKDAIYMKEDFSDEDGMRAAELEAEYAELGGYESESEASTLLQGLGIDVSKHYQKMSELKESDKIKVLLAQALFGKPDVILLDEPTNGIDLRAVMWLQEFLINFDGIVIVVSHDRYFLNEVCTAMVDIDFAKIRMYTGNYDFWYESSQLALKMAKDETKKKEEKAKELKDFIQRFSANKSKAKQATSRKKLLEKITLDDIQPSTRRYPFVGFTLSREPGNEILNIDNLNIVEGDTVLIKNLTMRVNKDDKIAFIGNEIAISKFFDLIAYNDENEEKTFNWGQTITREYLPKDNAEFFGSGNYNLIDWLRQYSKDKSESFIRGFLGKMLFSGDEVYKDSSVLSGGEKVRMMFSKMMVEPSNLIILDQPTNHLDLESIEAVNNGLINYKGNILFTSHDHQFVNSIANRIVEIFDDGSYRDEKTTYDDYIEKYVRGNN